MTKRAPTAAMVFFCRGAARVIHEVSDYRPNFYRVWGFWFTRHPCLIQMALKLIAIRSLTFRILSLWVDNKTGHLNWCCCSEQVSNGRSKSNWITDSQFISWLLSGVTAFQYCSTHAWSLIAINSSTLGNLLLWLDNNTRRKVGWCSNWLR